MINFLEKNKDITNLSNFKTKAFSKYYFEINTKLDLDNLKQVLLFANNNNLKYIIIWWWTNILFAFDIYDWIIIKNNLKWFNYDLKDKILEAYSWESISDLSLLLKDKYWQNLFERFIWLPWSIWWAIYWNAWCFWLEISSNFIEATILNLETLQIEKISKINMNFSYRNSYLKETSKYFLISAKFDLSYNNEKYPIWDVDIYDFRQNKQPKWNSCWSFFKNPSKEFSAWYLIEKIWFKWYNLNWAYFSSIHSNFLMNDWNAWYKDILNLIKITREKVKKEYNIDLIPEVNIIYN